MLMHTAHKSGAISMPGLLDWARLRREKWFTVMLPDDLAKLEFLRRQAHELARDPFLIELAARIVRPFRADDWRSQADALHRFVRDGIRYQRHPDKKQQIADNALWRGYGACTEKVMAFVAMCLALGIDADFWPLWKGDVMDHVQSAVRFPGFERWSPRSGTQPGAPPGLWIVSDPTIAGAELGQDPRTVPVNTDTGKLPLSG
jgi:transglutaminase-like putative cysteine protease